MPTGIYCRTEEHKKKISLSQKGRKHPEEVKRKMSATHTMDVNKRFWSKVDIKGEDECWEWMSGKFKDGYGNFSIKSRPKYAHRIAWELIYGAIPEGMLICHTCDNPSCCNPHHLFLGGDKENKIDCVNKNRQAKGEECATSKLTEQDVICTRILKQTGLTAIVISKMYNVGIDAIYAICNRETWKHI